MSLPQGALRWACAAVGSGATAAGARPLSGATSSELHALDIIDRGCAYPLVLRRFTNAVWLSEELDLVAHEAAALVRAGQGSVPVPQLVAVDETGEHCGAPALLMTRLPGAVELQPRDIEAWLRGLAEALVGVHTISPASFPWTYSPYVDVNSLDVPAWSTVPALWERAIEILQGPKPPTRERFIHRDYHPVNVLWAGERVSGVVDWPNGCRGPAEEDLAHCRHNLVYLYGLDVADRFLAIYWGLVDVAPGAERLEGQVY